MEWSLWLKSIHLVAVMAWMAGLWYLPRLFVYHTEAAKNKEKYTCLLLSKMERRLIKIITLPALFLTWISGLGLLAIGGSWYLTQGWFHVKLLAVVFMTCYNGYLLFCFAHFSKGKVKHSGKFFRVINEIPTFLVIIIVVMVVVRP